MPRRNQSQSQRLGSPAPQTSSQESQSSPPDSQANKHLMNQLVKAILNLSCNKAIMKRADIIKMALNGNGRMFDKLFNEVNDLLKEVYGYELIEVDKNKNLMLCSTVLAASMLDLNENYRKSFNDDFTCITWGVRAEHELSKQVLESLCTTMNRNPMDFKSQNIEAEGLVSPPPPENTTFGEYIRGDDFVEENVETVQKPGKCLKIAFRFWQMMITKLVKLVKAIKNL